MEREDVLRAEVQLSESREALVLAREGEFDAVARLNNAMGRNAGLPLEVIDLDLQPPLPGRWPTSWSRRRPSGRRSAWPGKRWRPPRRAGKRPAAEFLPRIFVRADAG